jgi:uncharacterized protein (TIGR02145 family)
MKKSILFCLFVLVTGISIFVECNKKVTEPGKIIAAPILISPEHGSILTTNTVKLQWNNVVDAEKYEVVVDNSNKFSNPEFSSLDIQETEITTSSLNAGLYYWRVRAENGVWSKIWIFTIGTKDQSAPNLVKPANSSIIDDTTPSFDWKNVSRALAYELQVDTSSSFSNPVICKKNLGNSGFTYSGELLPDTYFWRVRSKKNRLGDYTCWSDTWWFTIFQLKDIDGNVYETFIIGNQCWMAENLKVTHYRNGDPIPNVTDSSAWAGLTSGACCSYDNDDAHTDLYGRLYNWYAVDDNRNIEPEGWHIPTDDEWKELEMALGMSQSETDELGLRGTDAGGKLKETGTAHWNVPNTGATNESGFSALPAGSRGNNGIYNNIGECAFFWSSSEVYSSFVWYRGLYYIYSDVERTVYYKQIGISVRCVRD